MVKKYKPQLKRKERKRERVCVWLVKDIYIKEGRKEGKSGGIVEKHQEKYC